MSEDIKIKKENLQKNIEDLFKLIEEKFDEPQKGKIYENLTTSIREEFEKLNQPIQKCSSCGILLDPWEKGICGPCKIADERYEEEED